MAGIHSSTMTLRPGAPLERRGGHHFKGVKPLVTVVGHPEVALLAVGGRMVGEDHPRVSQALEA